MTVHNKAEMRLLYGGLFLVATCLNSLAPLMLEFQRVFIISMSVSALIPASQSCGTILANLTATWKLGVTGTRRAARIGIMLNVTGLFLLLMSRNMVMLCLGFFFVGSSFALILTTFSTIMAHLPEQHQRFSRLHAFFGLGGLTGPLLANQVLRTGHSYHLVFAVELAAALVYMGVLFFRSVPDFREERQAGERSAALFRPALAVVLVLLGLYSVSEMSLAIWSPNSFARTLGWEPYECALILSGFWLTFTLGRYFGDYLIHRWQPARLIRTFTFSSGVFLLLFTWGDPAFKPAAFLLTALSISTLFPAIHFSVNRRVPPSLRSSLNAALFLTVSGAGLVGIPLIGIVADVNMSLGFTLLLVPYLSIFVFLPPLLAKVRREDHVGSAFRL